VFDPTLSRTSVRGWGSAGPRQGPAAALARGALLVGAHSDKADSPRVTTHTSSFKEAAERRVAELEQRDRDRQVAREAKAAEDRAGQTADRERREQVQRQAAEQQAAGARARNARRYGIAATKGAGSLFDRTVSYPSNRPIDKTY
jgi:hypothetical protein